MTKLTANDRKDLARTLKTLAEALDQAQREHTKKVNAAIAAIAHGDMIAQVADHQVPFAEVNVEAIDTWLQEANEALEALQPTKQQSPVQPDVAALPVPRSGVWIEAS